jgi:hypothetical protein
MNYIIFVFIQKERHLLFMYQADTIHVMVVPVVMYQSSGNPGGKKSNFVLFSCKDSTQRCKGWYFQPM